MINAEIWCAIQALTAEYWLRVDRISDKPVEDLYAEDAHMQVGTALCQGREEIGLFFRDRAAGEIATGRTTRHAPYSLALEALSPERVRIRSTVQVIAGTGKWPLPSALPASVADFDDIAVQDSQGKWRFESRVARMVFTGDGAASFAR